MLLGSRLVATNGSSAPVAWQALGSAIDAAVLVVVAQVPGLAGWQPLAASPAVRLSRFDDRHPALAFLLMRVPIPRVAHASAANQ